MTSSLTTAGTQQATRVQGLSVKRTVLLRWGCAGAEPSIGCHQRGSVQPRWDRRAIEDRRANGAALGRHRADTRGRDDDDRPLLRVGVDVARTAATPQGQSPHQRAYASWSFRPIRRRAGGALADRLTLRINERRRDQNTRNGILGRAPSRVLRKDLLLLSIPQVGRALLSAPASQPIRSWESGQA